MEGKYYKKIFFLMASETLVHIVVRDEPNAQTPCSVRASLL